MAAAGHFLAAEIAAVDDQGHFVAVAVHPDGYFFSFVSRQVPVRQDMQDRLVRPPGLQVIRLVFGEAAIVQDAEFRTGGRILQRVGFAAVVEAGPVEQAGQPGPGRIELPAPFDAVIETVRSLGAAVERRHPAGSNIIVVNPARAAAGGFLRPERHPQRIISPVLVDRILEDIIVPGHIGSFQDLGAAAGSHHHGTGWIEPVAEPGHRPGDPFALLIPFNPPFFVADAPQQDAGVMAVTLDHLAERFQLRRIDAHQPRLFQDIHAQAVADVQQGGRSRIVGGADGIDAVALQLLDAIHIQRVGDGGTHTGMVLVDIHAVDAEHLAVDQDTPVGIDLDFRARTCGYRLRFPDGQPDMAVNAATFVEPAFLKARVGPDGHHVLTAVVQVFGNCIGRGSISTFLPAQPEAVDPDVRVAEDAVEAQRHGLAQRVGRDGEMLAVPAYAGGGIFPAHGLVAVAVAGLRRERQVHDPVVRQADLLPGAVIEIHGIGSGIVDGSRFREIIEVFRSPPEILLRRGGVTESELPAVVEQHFLRRQGHAEEKGRQQQWQSFHQARFNQSLKLRNLPDNPSAGPPHPDRRDADGRDPRPPRGRSAP